MQLVELELQEAEELEDTDKITEQLETLYEERYVRTIIKAFVEISLPQEDLSDLCPVFRTGWTANLG